MKKKIASIFLLIAVGVLTYVYSAVFIPWNTSLYACTVAALFVVAVLSFLVHFSDKKFSARKAVLYSLLGGAAYSAAHFATSFLFNSIVFQNDAPYLTAVIIAAFNAIFFGAFSVSALLNGNKTLPVILSFILSFAVFISGFLPAQQKILTRMNAVETNSYQGDLEMSDLQLADSPHITDRLYNSHWGVFIHYLYTLQNNPEHPSNLGVGETDWNTCVNDFDVDLLASQLHECGAHFLFITLMQGSRYMIAPNETYNRITGMKPGEACAERDLVLDLYNALEPYGIDLYLYSTGDGPHLDEVCGSAMGYVEGQVSMEFVKNWASVMEEYALRYGDKVKGWWFDGCYRSSFGYTDELLGQYYLAVKAGNPNAVVAFNDGVSSYYKKNYVSEDFVCGEFTYFNVLPRSRFIDGAQAFLLAPLGVAPEGMEVWSSWARPGTRYSGEYMNRFIACANESGGVVAIDVGMKRDGSLYEEQLTVLKEIEQ